jgi:putative acetyltransferase
MTVSLRPYLPSDAARLADIFVASIEEIASEDYSAAQCEAWTRAADDPAFARRIAESLTLIGLVDGEVAGFVSLKGAEQIDLLYVHPQFARQKVATTLCDAIEKLAGARGAKQLSVDASDTAQPFFAQRGYMAERRNTVVIEDQWLGNTTMRKQLAANDSGAPGRRLQ